METLRAIPRTYVSALALASKRALDAKINLAHRMALGPHEREHFTTNDDMPSVHAGARERAAFHAKKVGPLITWLVREVANEDNLDPVTIMVHLEQAWAKPWEFRGEEVDGEIHY